MPGQGCWGNSQPPAGVALDRGHPWAQHLQHLWPFNDGGAGAGGTTQDVAAGAVGQFKSGAVWRRGGHGTGAYCEIGTNNQVLLGTTDGLQLPTHDCTILLGQTKLDPATLAPSFSFAVDDGGDATLRLNAQLPWSDGVTSFDFGGASEGTTRLSVSGLTYGDDFWAFTAGPRGMEIWQNSILRASNAGNPTRGTTSAPFALGAAIGKAVTADRVLAWYFAVFAKQLPKGTLAGLSALPFAMFAPPVWRRYFISSVAVQTAVPISDISSGSWTPSTGASLFGTIDETVADDSDFDSSGVTPTADVMEVRLTSLTDPSSSTGHSVSYRYRKPSN